MKVYHVVLQIRPLSAQNNKEKKNALRCSAGHLILNQPGEANSQIIQRGSSYDIRNQ